MGVTSYLTVNGEILSETRNGVRSDYIPDPQGSTAALINSSGTITDTFTWWPFGEQRSHVGSSVTPMGYLGTLGYYTNWSNGSIYVRRRVLLPNLARWLTVDLLWPQRAPFVYAKSSPIRMGDPSGLSPVNDRSSSNDRAQLALDDLCAISAKLSAGNLLIVVAFNNCVKGSGCDRLNDDIIDCLSWPCDPRTPTQVWLDTNVGNSSCVGECGYTDAWGNVHICSDQCGNPKAGCNHFGIDAAYHMVLIHEVLHTCGVDHPGTKGYPADCKCNNIMACCLLKAAGLIPKSTSCRAKSTDKC